MIKMNQNMMPTTVLTPSDFSLPGIWESKCGFMLELGLAVITEQYIFNADGTGEYRESDNTGLCHEEIDFFYYEVYNNSTLAIYTSHGDSYKIGFSINGHTMDILYDDGEKKTFVKKQSIPE